MAFTLRITLTREHSFEIRATAKVRQWCPVCNSDSDFVDTAAFDRQAGLVPNAAHRSSVKGREYLCLGSLNVTEIDENRPD